MLDNLLASELNWRMTASANDRAARGLDTVLFTDGPSHAHLPPACAVMNAHDVWGYPHPVIATNLATASRLISAATPPVRIFYAWDLEWLRLTDPPYRLLREVYGNESLKIVCRTQEHADIMEKLWHRQVLVAAQPDIDTILTVVSTPKGDQHGKEEEGRRGTHRRSPR